MATHCQTAMHIGSGEHQNLEAVNSVRRRKGGGGGGGAANVELRT